jgi:hypothetical protein
LDEYHLLSEKVQVDDPLAGGADSTLKEAQATLVGFAKASRM